MVQRSVAEVAPTPAPTWASSLVDEVLAIDTNRASMLARATLVASLPTRMKMFENGGVGALHHANGSQLDLDERPLLVTVDWEAKRADGNPLLLRSTFLLRREEGGPRILVYLNHGDVAAVLFPGAHQAADQANRRWHARDTIA